MLFILLTGSRLDVSQLLDKRIKAGWERVGVAVCGPCGLCDDARAAVVAAGKLGRWTLSSKSRRIRGKDSLLRRCT